MNKMFRAKTNFIHRKVAKRDILIPVAGNVANFNGYIELNETYLFLWERLKEPCTGAQLCDAVQEQYDVAPEKAAADIAAFLALYLDHQMIEAV